MSSGTTKRELHSDDIAGIHWIYGTSICCCPCWADPQCDGVRSEVLDVVQTVNVAFRGFSAVTDPGCPNQRSDVDASGFTDVLDVVKVVNVAFRGFSVASQYVDPCSPPNPNLERSPAVVSKEIDHE
jgi:hypothetical protein